MANLNKVFLIGNLTRDPELRVTPRGTPICQFGLAISRQFKDESGQTAKKQPSSMSKLGENKGKPSRSTSPKVVRSLLKAASSLTSGRIKPPSKNAANSRWCWKTSSSSAAAKAAPVDPLAVLPVPAPVRKTTEWTKRWSVIRLRRARPPAPPLPPRRFRRLTSLTTTFRSKRTARFRIVISNQTTS